jgi:hypothetical protein
MVRHLSPASKNQISGSCFFILPSANAIKRLFLQHSKLVRFIRVNLKWLSDFCAKRHLHEATFVQSDICAKRQLRKVTFSRSDICAKQHLCKVDLRERKMPLLATYPDLT